MKKLLMFAVFFIAVSIFGMELITKQDNLSFAKRLAEGLNYDRQMIKENKISEHNPIHVIIKKVDSNFTECGNDLSVMIKKHSLGYRLNEYIKIDNEPLVKLGLEQIHQKRGKIEEAQEYVTKIRKSYAQLLLQKKQPNFKPFLFGSNRLNFMLDNQYYPLNDAAVNDYMAMAIYRYILAEK